MATNTEMREKNLGHVTAYAYAVAGGYTGTKEEFEAGLIASATQVQRAEGYASGTEDGVQITDPDSPYYHNSAKYYMEQASRNADDIAELVVGISNFYAVCSSDADAAEKVITVENLPALVAGLNIRVKFADINTAANPVLAVNDLEPAPIVFNDMSAPGTSMMTSWKPGAVVSLTYDGTAWIIDGSGGGSSENGIYFVVGTQGSQTNVWTGDLPEVDELYNGLTIAYLLPYPGTSVGATLTLTLAGGVTTNAVPIYVGGSLVTNQYGTNSVIILTYVNNAWRRADYNVDTNTHLTMLVKGHKVEGTNAIIDISTDSDFVPSNYSYNFVRFPGPCTISTNNTNAGNIKFNFTGTGVRTNVVVDGSSTFDRDHAVIIPKGNYLVYYYASHYELDTQGYIPGRTATASKAGLMSATDKNKLTGVAYNANNYTLPDATSSVKGGVMIEDTPTANSTKAITSGAVYSALESINSVDFHICTNDEFDASTGVPTIEDPDFNTFYLVPDSSGDAHDLFVEWVFKRGNWEIFGGARVDLTNYLQTTDVDSSPTSGSNNPVSSGGVYTALAAKPDADTHLTMKCSSFETGSIEDDGSTFNYIAYVVDVANDFVPVGSGYSLIRFEQPLSYTNNTSGNVLYRFKIGNTLYDLRFGSAAGLTYGGTRSISKGSYPVYFDGSKFILRTDGYLPGKSATEEYDGLMSFADKIKLNGIANNANNYTLPDATSSVKGGVMIESTPTQNSTKAITSGGVYAALANMNSVDFHICSSGEYNSSTGVPTVSNPDPNTFYLVPSGDVSGNDLFVEWVYKNNGWEIFGGARVDLTGYLQTSDVDAVPTDGSSNPVSSDGVYDALSGKQDTLTFDNTPTASSDNPVKSQGIKSAIDAVVKVSDTQPNETGNKLWIVDDDLTEYQVPTTEEFTSAVTALNNAVEDIIAPQYEDLDFPVSPDHYCWHEGTLYVSLQNIMEQEAWDPSHWDEADPLAKTIAETNDCLANKIDVPYQAGTTGQVLTVDQYGGYIWADSGGANLPTEETAQELLEYEQSNTGLTDIVLMVIGQLFDNLPQNETATDILHSLELECERLDAIYTGWIAERVNT